MMDDLEMWNTVLYEKQEKMYGQTKRKSSPINQDSENINMLASWTSNLYLNSIELVCLFCKNKFNFMFENLLFRTFLNSL